MLQPTVAVATSLKMMFVQLMLTMSEPEHTIRLRSQKVSPCLCLSVVCSRGSCVTGASALELETKVIRRYAKVSIVSYSIARDLRENLIFIWFLSHDYLIILMIYIMVVVSSHT